MSDSNLITSERFDAVLFDLDGVLTATAKIHAACWKQMFDRFLRQYAEIHNLSFQPFDIQTDYNLHVDGKALDDGVRSFLESRHIELPDGSPDAPPDWETVHGLGTQKDTLVNQVIASDGVEAFPGSMAFATHVRQIGLKTAVVTPSANCTLVLRSAGITHLFDLRVDRDVAAQEQLAGKPAPDMFLAAAEKLNVLPARAVVIEDAISGVQSGRAGNFGLVIGVDRRGHGDLLKENGADIVVKDVGDLLSPAAHNPSRDS
ncbi:MAG: beta-phosphoglucomutase family hydrolase [Desulfurellaceae bacterium]|nr:beta-phosphoglucomutase family hydrolase [Desulfurellaceae bacterium]